jgi:hypothetical protein
VEIIYPVITVMNAILRHFNAAYQLSVPSQSSTRGKYIHFDITNALKEH